MPVRIRLATHGQAYNFRSASGLVGEPGRAHDGDPACAPDTTEVTVARMNVCSQSGCPEVQAEKRCPEHRRQAERARGSRQQRGYGAEHDRLRARWKPKVEACSVHCHAKVCIEPVRLILPGQAWDLGHSEDRTTWTGPEHARCNRAAGGRASHGG